ncbi:hypothetical protein CEXT_405711 [Caerostris extrusa]|uniref:Uncharacterized protein n=1 Tax=Caerostris extrusa TaxID=172846 RepID=A0AAV4UNG4_CAEEX|nr:hypothetical protein CEXT_405711 [Caerostris extrusa]
MGCAARFLTLRGGLEGQFYLGVFNGTYNMFNVYRWCEEECVLVRCDDLNAVSSGIRLVPATKWKYELVDDLRSIQLHDPEGSELIFVGMKGRCYNKRSAFQDNQNEFSIRHRAPFLSTLDKKYKGSSIYFITMSWNQSSGVQPVQEKCIRGQSVNSCFFRVLNLGLCRSHFLIILSNVSHILSIILRFRQLQNE